MFQRKGPCNQNLFFVPNVDGGEDNAPEEEEVYGSGKQHSILVQDGDVLLESGDVSEEGLEGIGEHGVLGEGVGRKPGGHMRSVFGSEEREGVGG